MLKSNLFLVLMFALSSTAAFAMEVQGPEDYVKERARLRRERYWEKLTPSNQPIGLRTFSTDTDEKFTLRRLSIDRKFENTIRYNVTLPEYLLRIKIIIGLTVLS